MARAYTIATAALALEVTRKWLDNTVSHFTVPGVAQRRQGVARRLSLDALLRLAIATRLGRTLAVPLGSALEIADRLVQNDGQLTSTDMMLTFDLAMVRATLLRQLEVAVEIAPVPRRGRPPKTTTGRLD